jgi:hypothetical protein
VPQVPNVRKLSNEEVRTIERKTLGLRRAIEAEYDTFLRDFAPGDYGEAVLEPEEKRLTVRSRLKAAAARQTPPLQLTFPRTRDKAVVRFKVGEAAQNGASEAVAAPTAAPVVEEAKPVASDAPPPRKPGRPRKNPEGASPAAATPRTRTRRAKSA